MRADEGAAAPAMMVAWKAERCGVGRLPADGRHGAQHPSSCLHVVETPYGVVSLLLCLLLTPPICTLPAGAPPGLL